MAPQQIISHNIQC